MTDLKARIAILQPLAGDTIVITTPWPMTDEQRRAYQQEAANCLPEGVKVLVLCGGSTLMHIMAPGAGAKP